MDRTLEVFLSNRLEILYQQLKLSLFGSSTKPLIRRLVVVYGPAMKNWLSLRMAQDPDLNVAMGIEFIYLGQAFEYLLPISTDGIAPHFPSALELSLAIEAELQSTIQKYPSLDSEERIDWEPVFHYLKLKSDSSASNKSLPRKVEKRLIGLSEHLARLFLDYGRYSLEMAVQWEKPETAGWQPRLWRKLFIEKKGWSYPSSALQQEIAPEDFSLHLFSISFMTRSEFAFLNRLARHVQVHYYLLSPCAVFWSDIRSDRESAFLERYWQKKLGDDSPQVRELEELLRDRNPLLANFGRIGREMACQIEESEARTYARYALPAHLKELNGDLPFHDDLQLTESESPLSLLHALQADLLLMRNPQESLPFNFERRDLSLQLHIAPCRRREVEILYHNLLRLMLDNPSLCPGDVIVMAPQIEEYAPYIQSLFGTEHSQLEFQILDLGMKRQSAILQGFLLLLELAEGRWNAGELMQLFGHPSFQRCHQISPGDNAEIQEWIEEAGIRWGDDWVHRNELLEQSHCRRGMAEETRVGTWDYGISRLMLGLVASQETLFEVPLSAAIAFSDVELFGKWIRLLHALRDDLAPLHDGSRLTLSDWVNYLHCLLENYFKPEMEDQQSAAEYDELKEIFEFLRGSSAFIQDARLTFISIKTRLLPLFENKGIAYREERLQAVRFCSLMPLRSIPSQVVALLGMQEEAFPRITLRSSLNLMQDKRESGYCPLSSDFDRYLFLEALHSAQEYLLLSYCGFSQEDNKELNPSLVIEELFSYLDLYYTMEGSKISEKCRFKHPFDAFDPLYFIAGTNLNNFSIPDFHAAQTLCKSDKLAPYRFVNSLDRLSIPVKECIPSNSALNLKQLINAAKDPIKLYFNKTLEMYLETSDDRQVQTEEELALNQLERSHFMREAVNQPIETVLARADKEGKLPFGLFKEVAQKRLKRECEELIKNLEKHSISPSAIFEIEFAADCTSPFQQDEKRWIFPPVVLSYEEGYHLSIVGKLPFATQKGLLTMSKDTFSDIWKTWPQFLLYCSAAKLLPQQLNPQLIPVENAKSKQPFFEDPEPYLKRFVQYYALCLQKISPLMPDWIPLFLEQDGAGLQDKISALIAEKGRGYQSPYHQMVFNCHPLDCSEEMINVWKEEAELLAGEIMQSWFQKKHQEAAG